MFKKTTYKDVHYWVLFENEISKEKKLACFVW